MSDYEKVRFFLTLVSSSDRSGGECYGSGRGAMLDGTFCGFVLRKMEARGD